MSALCALSRIEKNARVVEWLRETAPEIMAALCAIDRADLARDLAKALGTSIRKTVGAESYPEVMIPDPGLAARAAALAPLVRSMLTAEELEILAGRVEDRASVASAARVELVKRRGGDAA